MKHKTNKRIIGLFLYQAIFAFLVLLAIPLAVVAQNSCPSPQNYTGSASSDAKDSIAATQGALGGEVLGAATSDALDYRLDESAGDGAPTVIMGKVSKESITGFNYQGNNVTYINYGIHQLKGADCGDVLRDNDTCYSLKLDGLWDSPSVYAPVRSTWDFLTEAYNKVMANPTADPVTRSYLDNAKASYAAEAFRDWHGSDVFKLTSSSTSVSINLKEFFEIEEVKAKLGTADPYAAMQSTSDPENPQRLVLSLRSEYPLAKPNSLWLDGIGFILTSVIPKEQEFGIGLDQQIEKLTNWKTIYNQYAAANGSSTSNTGAKGILSLSGPSQIVISDTGQALTGGVQFTTKIDQTKYPKPTDGNYKTEVYVKPDAKKESSDPYIKVLTTADPSTQFSWSEIFNAGYVTNSGPLTITQAMKDNGTAVYYDKTFPQKYFMHALTYEKDGSTLKDDVTFSFDTTPNLSSGSTVSATGIFTNGSFSITAPSVWDKSKKVPFKMTAIDNNTEKKLNKIVIWVCRGAAGETLAGDSSNCQDGNGGEQVKAAFLLKGISGSGIEFEYTGNSATKSTEWDASGTTIGTYSLMAKGYNVDSNGNVISELGSKVATTIKLTSASVAGPGDDPTYVKDRLPTGNAFKDARGSKFTNVKSLAARIIQIILWATSALSVIAVIIGGIMYIASGGDQKLAERGKKTLIYAIIGIMIAVSGWTLYWVILDLINKLVK